MYSNITKLKINNKEVYIHTDILKEYDYFNELLKAGKEIDIQIGLNKISLTDLINSFYAHSIINTNFEEDSWDELIKVLNYLKPNEPQTLNKLSEIYLLNNEKNRININIKSNNNKNVLKTYLKLLVEKNNLPTVTTSWTDFWGCHSMDGG